MLQATNKFFDTAVGKSLQTLMWTVASYALAIILSQVANVHWSDKIVALGVPGLINWVLYTSKVIVDKEVPTLPSSPAMLVIPRPDEPVVVQPSGSSATVSSVKGFVSSNETTADVQIPEKAIDIVLRSSVPNHVPLTPAKPAPAPAPVPPVPVTPVLPEPAVIAPQAVPISEPDTVEPPIS